MRTPLSNRPPHMVQNNWVRSRVVLPRYTLLRTQRWISKFKRWFFCNAWKSKSKTPGFGGQRDTKLNFGRFGSSWQRIDPHNATWAQSGKTRRARARILRSCPRDVVSKGHVILLYSTAAQWKARNENLANISPIFYGKNSAVSSILYLTAAARIQGMGVCLYESASIRILTRESINKDWYLTA